MFFLMLERVRIFGIGLVGRGELGGREWSSVLKKFRIGRRLNLRKFKKFYQMSRLSNKDSSLDSIWLRWADGTMWI